MMNKFNQFHMVSMSPWPILISTQTHSTMMQVVLNNTMKMNKMNNTMYMMMMIMIPTAWWKNILSEANKEGTHQKKTKNMMKTSMIMFISSEVLFFTSFFWSYFHMSTSPNMEVGQFWPPMSIETFNPINVPLLNTMILISSGFSITWSHHLMVEKNLKKSKMLMMVTCFLGIYFSILQSMEYLQAQFSMTDSSYGTIFFVATGFHGAHVMVGTTFLMVNLVMMNKFMLTNEHHLGYELAAWYWHFVDIVWLFLYLSIYWWGK